MQPIIDNRKRRRLIVATLTEALKPLEFRHHHGDYFSRPRGPLLDAFFYQFSRSNGRFTITYGIDAPDILGTLRRMFDVDSRTPSLWVSRSADRLGDYGCRHEDHILNCGDKVRADLESRAIPWFSTITTIEDFVEAYRRYEIGMDAPMSPPPPGVELRWGIFGMMLAEAKDRTNAVRWLDAAANAWTNRSPGTDEQAKWIHIINSTRNSL